jgi:hypothetical protein
MHSKGQMTIFIAIFFLALLFGAILLVTGGMVVTKINNALDLDIDLGQVNLKDTNEETFGKVEEMYTNNADFWGMSLIIGLILGLFGASYFTRNTFPKWGIVLDIFILVAFFIFALYMSSTYQTTLDALASAEETFLEDETPKFSMFLLNLPVFVVIIGVVAMVLFHSSIPRKQEERIQQGGYLQGAY